MQAAELIMEPGDEGTQLEEEEAPIGQEQEDGTHEEHEMVDEDQQQLVTTTTVEPTLVQAGGKEDVLDVVILL